tara:strand:- start:10489 stop:11112 length:624 start_codon:yes stop_codon:yes gene_type:complete
MIFKTSLFDIPIYKSHVPNQNEIKTKFVEQILPVINTMPPNNKQLNLYSDYFEGIDKLDKKEWIKLYQPTIEKFKEKAGFNKNQKWFTGMDLWFNVGVQGSQQEEHDHMGGFPSCVYSAIHYLIYDPNEHESTVFFNPIHYTFLRNQHMCGADEELPVDWSQPNHFPKVDEGDIVFFPSYVRHAVPYQNSEKIRATIAMNLTIYRDH